MVKLWALWEVDGESRYCPVDEDGLDFPMCVSHIPDGVTVGELHIERREDGQIEKVLLDIYDEHTWRFVRWQSVDSSDIAAIAYHEPVLWVKFKNDAVYEYADVPEGVYVGFVDAASKGKFFHGNIKGKFQHVRRA